MSVLYLVSMHYRGVLKNDQALHIIMRCLTCTTKARVHAIIFQSDAYSHLINRHGVLCLFVCLTACGR